MATAESARVSSSEGNNNQNNNFATPSTSSIAAAVVGAVLGLAVMGIAGLWGYWYFKRSSPQYAKVVEDTEVSS